jgi:TRAP transporter 4TM/12TM fusion protein
MSDPAPSTPDWLATARLRLGELCCVALALFIAGTTVFGRFPAEAQYATALTLGLVALFALKPSGGARLGAWGEAALSALMIAGAVGTGLYYLFNYHDIAAFRDGIPNDADLLCYALGTLIVVEAARRAEGWVLVAVVALAFVYMAYGHLMPGVLRHRPMPISNALEVAYSYRGIFGVALGAVVNVVLVFVILGAAIRVSGAGDFFNFVAARATRGLRSGPAQAAIIASTLFGSINGSPPANVSSTGVLTIPMMRRAGYKAGFAGGVEATASCVGQIMPPVMGVGAFIMSELTGEPYSRIMLMAIVPAFLFIASLSVSAMLEADRLGMKPSDEDVGGWTPLRQRQGVVLLGAFGTLLTLLFTGYSPTFAGLASAGVTLLLAMIMPQTRFGLDEWWRFLVDSGRDGLSVMIACAAIGVVIGAVSATGLGIKLNQMIVSAGDGQLLMALGLAALCSIVLGMGLPTAASYLMVVFVAGPSLIELGVPLLQAHFFVFYYAVLSAITPPVALAVFAAAAIARERPLIIARDALRLCAVGFLLPVIWTYHPEIFLDTLTWDGLPAFALTLTAVVLAIIAINAAHVGHLGVKLTMVMRVAFLFGAGLAFHENWQVQVGGSIAIALLLMERYTARRTLPT